jgi:uncharacterized protein (UPF0276 family)
MLLPTSVASNPGTVPAAAGIGLRAEHYRDVLETRPPIGWFEVHSENYFGAGGAPLFYLEKVRAEYPLSLHGVGLSLGSSDALDRGHLKRIKALVERFAPGLVSEHLSWSSVDGRYLNDLAPLPFTEEALSHVVSRIDQVQSELGRAILVENVSSYLEFTDSIMPEWEFVAETARRAGCGLLLDVNNVYVAARNHGFDPYRYVNSLPADRVREIHLAGFTVKQFADGEILIDTHNRPVADDVWRLYRHALGRFGRLPSLIEWDADLPPLESLLAEAARAQAILEQCDVLAA